MNAVPTLFRGPNLLVYSLPRRACSTCGTVGLKSLPFGAGCPNCGSVQVVSGFAVPFQGVPLGRSFYVVGHVSFPYQVWHRIEDRQIVHEGRPVLINAACEIEGRQQVLFLPPMSFIVPVEIAMIADRFSFN